MEKFNKLWFAVLLSVASAAGAQEKSTALVDGQPHSERVVPYKEISPENAEVKKIWMGPNGDESWWERPDDTRTTWLGKFTNEAGASIEISQWIDHYACSRTECPVVVFVDGRKVFDDRVCTDRSSHNLTPSANALFLCDRVIPLKAEAEE